MIGCDCATCKSDDPRDTRSRASILITLAGGTSILVDTSPDLRHARVYVSVLGAERKRVQTIDRLQAAHSLLQAQLARELRMKRTPQLAFEYDPSVERGVRMTKLIDELAPDDSE